MAKIVCLLLVSIFAAAYAADDPISCYVCGIGTQGKCDQSKELLPCGQSGTNPLVCSKIVTNGVAVKKCDQIPPGGKIGCTKSGDVETCYCDTKACNGAGAVTFSSFALMGIVVAYLAPKVFVH